MESSSFQLKQSGLPNDSRVDKTKLARYPTQYDESSIRTDINEAEISTYVRRAAAKAAENNQEYSCLDSLQCDSEVVVEDCPQNECYKNYLNPNIIDQQKLEPSKKVFFDNFKDILTTKSVSSSNSNQNPFQMESESYVQIRSRLDDLLQNRAPPCDQPNKVETQPEPQVNSNACSRGQPNQCDTVVPNDMDCNGQACYKKYLNEDLAPVKKDQKVTPNGMRVKFGEQENFLPLAVASGTTNGSKAAVNNNETTEFQKKYNTLIVNSDISVPQFVDVLVILSEKPIKISLPSLKGPALASTIGKVVSTSNLLIKNLSLCSHTIVASGNNKIDTVRTSVAIEPAGKKTLGAVNDTWILL
jgi:hypothetical protein